MNKEGMRSALGWDAGTGGTMEWKVVDRSPGEVAVAGRERNEFLRLLGVESLGFRSRFTVDDEGRIRHQTYATDGSGASYGEALERAVEWAREHEPAELAAIYPGGRIRYSEETGRRWVALLERWRTETGPGPAG